MRRYLLSFRHGYISWKTRPDGSSQQAEVEATAIPPTNDRESALLQVLPAGNNTTILRGKKDTTGTGLVEIYQLRWTARQLAQLSELHQRRPRRSRSLATSFLKAAAAGDESVVASVEPKGELYARGQQCLLGAPYFTHYAREIPAQDLFDTCI